MRTKQLEEVFSYVSEAYLEGYKSFFNKEMLRNNCPYLGAKREEWLKGWDEAKNVPSYLF